MKGFPYSFKEEALLTRALTVPVANDLFSNNQRLEFLGDAVIQLLVTDRLFRDYPEAQEGVLTDMRLHLVSGKSLAMFSERIQLRKLLAVCNREGTIFTHKICADAFEAIFGATWMDGGLEAVQKLFATVFRDEDFESLGNCTGVSDNPKGELQQVAQRMLKCEPTYVLLERKGLDHLPEFRCGVSLGTHSAEGVASSIRAAESEAARQLLEVLTNE
ncbi:MAG: ribonuclease III domain-containing protein [Kiritimatiellia bacterium]